MPKLWMGDGGCLDGRIFDVRWEDVRMEDVGMMFGCSMDDVEMFDVLFLRGKGSLGKDE
jgi:hypothetical protein